MMLQALAAGLIVLCLFSMMVGQLSDIIMNLMLIYVLYSSWAQFNWMYCLMFFFYCIL